MQQRGARDEGGGSVGRWSRAGGHAGAACDTPVAGSLMAIILLYQLAMDYDYRALEEKVTG